MGNNIIIYLYAVPAILLSLSFHELSHAFVSYKLGDPTAKNVGRLTLNPIKHLDPFGTLMLLISMYNGFGFGWAKPVPINPVYYRNRKQGTMLVSLAGPASNILLAFIFSIPMTFIGLKYGATADNLFNINTFLFSTVFQWELVIFNICRFFFIMNIGLAVFNIIPVPPLDGSKILSGILPSRYYFKMMEYERYIGIAFLVLMVAFPRVLSTIMSPFIWAIENVIRLIVMPLTGI
jgi:Zn-dependent proteases